MASQQTHQNPQSHTALFRHCDASLATQSRHAIWLLTGLEESWGRNEESQVLAAPDLLPLLSLPPSSLIFRLCHRLLCEAPFGGRGVLYPPQFCLEKE